MAVILHHATDDTGNTDTDLQCNEGNLNIETELTERGTTAYYVRFQLPGPDGEGEYLPYGVRFEPPLTDSGKPLLDVTRHDADNVLVFRLNLADLEIHRENWQPEEQANDDSS